MDQKLNNLKFLKRFKNYSNQQMASVLDIGLRQYRNIENGSSQFDEQKILLIAEHFKVSVQDFLFLDLEKKAHGLFWTKGKDSVVD